MNFLFAIDRRFCPLLLDCLWSIFLCGGVEQCDAYIFHSDLCEGDMLCIRRDAPKAVTCHFIDVPKELFASFPVTERYPEQIYYRLAAPLLLPATLERILYMDVDIVIINSLVSLYESSFEGNLFMACTHTNDILAKVNALRLGLTLKENIPYINTGFMLLNLPLLRKRFDLNAVRSYALEKRNALILPDQDILTALYGSKVKLLDAMIYNLSDRTLALYNAVPAHDKRDIAWVRQNSVVIHYIGKNKPWLADYRGVLDVFYHENALLRRQGQPEEVRLYARERAGIGG